MFLSRVKLNPALRSTMNAFVRPSQFHGGIESSFTGERKRNLWRLDTLKGEPYLLILSEEQPSFEKLSEQFGYAGEYETKDYSPCLSRATTGSKWRFRLTANPTISKSAQGERGKVLAHISEQYQNEWFLRKAEANGFSVEKDEFLVTGVKWHKFNKGAAGKPVCLLAVTYEGTLTVADSEKFRQALCSGIGRGKAYGMGMLTIVRV